MSIVFTSQKKNFFYAYTKTPFYLFGLNFKRSKCYSTFPWWTLVGVRQAKFWACCLVNSSFILLFNLQLTVISLHVDESFNLFSLLLFPPACRMSEPQTLFSHHLDSRWVVFSQLFILFFFLLFQSIPFHVLRAYINIFNATTIELTFSMTNVAIN